MDNLKLGRQRAKELGLTLVSANDLRNEHRFPDILVYYADDVHELLSEGEKVSGFSAFPYPEHASGNYMKPITWHPCDIFKNKVENKEYVCPANHTAFVLGIKSIAQPPESEERKLLRELLGKYSSIISKIELDKFMEKVVDHLRRVK